jgi:hypothetical protein
MAEIIDFLSRKGAALRRKADKYAGLSRHYAARHEWLKQNGASIAEQVRASLDASKADSDYRRTEQDLALVQGVAAACLHS